MNMFHDKGAWQAFCSFYGALLRKKVIHLFSRHCIHQCCRKRSVDLAEENAVCSGTQLFPFELLHPSPVLSPPSLYAAV